MEKEMSGSPRKESLSKVGIWPVSGMTPERKRLKETLNYDEYLKAFPIRCIGPKPTGYVTEASRETAMVIINSVALAKTRLRRKRGVPMRSLRYGRSAFANVPPWTRL